MQVVKEVWLLKHKVMLSEFMCAQNTATPKLYVSENSAISSANYHATYYTENKETVYKPVKAYIVIEGEPNAIPF
jgi:hypothetical protein